MLIGTPLPLSDAALPVTLPEMSSYAPAGDGQPPLASASADWLECVPCEKRISFLSAFPLYGCLSVLWLSTTLCLSLSPFVYGVKGEKRLRWWIVLRRYTCEETGRRLRRETLTMPQWAGSCWYYLRFADPRNGERLIGQEEEKCGDHTTVHSHTILYTTDLRSWTQPIYIVLRMHWPAWMDLRVGALAQVLAAGGPVRRWRRARDAASLIRTVLA